MVVDTEDLVAANPVTEERVDAGVHIRRSVQLLLRSGLVMSFALMAAGLLTKVLGGNDTAGTVRLFHLAAVRDKGDLLMGLGIAVLAATPAVRVLALLLLWAKERDRKYVIVALSVLAVLSVAIAVGHG